MTEGLSGFYRASVAQRDGLTRKVRMRVPSVFGAVITGWAEPMLLDSPVPEVGAVVWAAFEAGDKDMPLYLSRRSRPSGGMPGYGLANAGEYDTAWQPIIHSH